MAGAVHEVTGFDYARFARDVRDFRIYSGLNQTELARRLNYCTDTVSRIEQQRYNMSLWLFSRVCAVCGLDRRDYWK